jgi:cell division septum initiation protein DivIVA
LAVPNIYDDKAKGEYLAKLRAMRKPPEEVAAPAATEAPAPTAELPDTVEPEVVEEPVTDATPDEPQDTPASRIRLSKEDLQEYEIPVYDEDGNITYLSYDEFNKTVGTYSKQNKKLRELAEREREVEALKTNLVAEQQKILQNTTNQEQVMSERYQWVQNSIAYAHQHGVDVVKFQDGTSKKVTQLIAEKTALETQYSKLQAQKQQAQQMIESAQADFIKAQDAILEQKAPSIKKARADITKFLERQGFTSEEASALSYSKAELLMLIDKAMRYENAQRGQVKEKKVATNTKVIKQSSRLAGRGTPVSSPSGGRIAELQALGTKAKPDELRELRRLQLQNR